METKMEDIIHNRPYGELLSEVKSIIEQSRRQAYQSVDTLLVRRNWYIGKQIAEEELHGAERADYGAQVISRLAEDLTNAYGKGFDASNLYKFAQFYKFFPNILDSLCLKSKRGAEGGDRTTEADVLFTAGREPAHRKEEREIRYANQSE